MVLWLRWGGNYLQGGIVMADSLLYALLTDSRIGVREVD